MLWTERDSIISKAVNGMAGMSYEEISDYLRECKGIHCNADHLSLYKINN